MVNNESLDVCEPDHSSEDNYELIGCSDQTQCKPCLNVVMLCVHVLVITVNFIGQTGIREFR